MDNLFKDPKYSVITLGGFGLTKAVYINGELIENFREGYEWGARASRYSLMLSEDILTQCLIEKPNKELIETFSEAVIQFIPRGNFLVKIALKVIVEMARGIDVGKNIHAHTLMQIKIGTGPSGEDVFVSKLLDLPCLPFATFIFDTNTIEHDLLAGMDKNTRALYKNYLSLNSKRSETNADGKTTIVELKLLEDIGYGTESSKFVFKDGLGLGTSKGCLKSNYIYTRF